MSTRERKREKERERKRERFEGGAQNKFCRRTSLVTLVSLRERERERGKRVLNTNFAGASLLAHLSHHPRSLRERKRERERERERKRMADKKRGD